MQNDVRLSCYADFLGTTELAKEKMESTESSEMEYDLDKEEEENSEEENSEDSIPYQFIHLSSTESCTRKTFTRRCVARSSSTGRRRRSRTGCRS